VNENLISKKELRSVHYINNFSLLGSGHIRCEG
jgi:hypothetical protein